MQINTSQEKAGEVTLIADEIDCNLRRVTGIERNLTKFEELLVIRRSNNSRIVCVLSHNFSLIYIQPKSIAL